MKADFKPGDRVEYCGIEAVVIANHGTSGTVEIPGEGRMSWYWEFQGEPVRLLAGQGMKAARYVGSMPDSKLPIRRDDTVTVRKGTLVFHRGQWKAAGRTYKVKVHRFSAIWVSSAATLSPYPETWPPISGAGDNGVLCPAVCFPGSGGYWSDVNLNDIPEAQVETT